MNLYVSSVEYLHPPKSDYPLSAKPHVEDGRAVPVQVLVPISFKLR